MTGPDASPPLEAPTADAMASDVQVQRASELVPVPPSKPPRRGDVLPSTLILASVLSGAGLVALKLGWFAGGVFAVVLVGLYGVTKGARERFKDPHFVAACAVGTLLTIGAGRPLAAGLAKAVAAYSGADSMLAVAAEFVAGLIETPSQPIPLTLATLVVVFNLYAPRRTNE